MIDKAFQEMLDKSLKPGTEAGAKRVLSVALNHARKYRYMESNPARDTLTKLGKADKTPDPYTPVQNGKCPLCWAACMVCAALNY